MPWTLKSPLPHCDDRTTDKHRALTGLATGLRLPPKKRSQTL
ncbi:hypothetical protein [Spirulina subsalsa]|nr:hypothetical protein [Spirulina subsalsa]